MNNVINTSCLGCAFAKTEDKVQEWNGCHFDVIRKMRAQGAEVTYEEDDHGHKYHLVNGRGCPYYRNKGWFGPEWDLSLAMDKVKGEVLLNYDAVIYADTSTTEDGLRATIDGLLAQAIRPQRLYVINNGFRLPSQMGRIMQAVGYPWRTHNIIEENCDKWRAIDIAAKACTAIFLTFYVAGAVPDANMSQKLNDSLYGDFNRFVLLHPLDDELNGLTIMRVFHKQCGGSRGEHNVIEKATNISEGQECPRLVQKLSQLLA